MIKGLVAALLLWGTGFSHPFHVSICDIDYDPSSRSLKITHRIFVDDLESVWQGTEGIQDIFMDASKSNQLDSLIQAYLKKNFSLVVNGKVQTNNYLGHETEGDVIWIYLEVVKVKKLQSIKVKNSILLDNFDDQTNFVHINYSGKVRSLQLTPNNPIGEVDLLN